MKELLAWSIATEFTKVEAFVLNLYFMGKKHICSTFAVSCNKLQDNILILFQAYIIIIIYFIKHTGYQVRPVLDPCLPLELH